MKTIKTSEGMKEYWRISEETKKLWDVEPSDVPASFEEVKNLCNAVYASHQIWADLIGGGLISPVDDPEECKCGGPEGHVPNGMNCRKP